MAWQEHSGLVWGVPSLPGAARFAIETPRPSMPNGNNFLDYKPNLGEDHWHRLNVANCGVPSGATIIRVAARLSISKGSIDGGEDSKAWVRMVGETEPYPDHMWKARAQDSVMGVREDSFAVDLPLVNDQFEFRWETTWNASSVEHPIGAFCMMFLGYWMPSPMA